MDPKYTYPEDCVLSIEYNRAGGSFDSAANDGQWQVVCADAGDCCQWIDYQRRNYNKYVNDYYRVVVRIPSASETFISKPVHAGSYLPGMTDSAKFNNLMRLADKQISDSGRQGVLLKRKVWGTRCPVCTDFEGQNSVNEHCPQCMGTGILGGYYKGIPMPVLQLGQTQQHAITQQGYQQADVLQAKCIAWPWIHLRDVWADSTTNERYYITNATVLSRYKSVPLVYQLTMNKVQLTDSIHDILADAKVGNADGSFVTQNMDWPQDDF